MHYRRALSVCLAALLTLPAAGSASAQLRSGWWTGYHDCRDGRIPTQASINVDGAGSITGLRQFQNPQGMGSFQINGNYQSSTGSVSLFAGNWILQPPGFLKCDLFGRLDASGTRISGNSPGCPCGNFELVLQGGAATPAAPDPNQGGCCSWVAPNIGRTCAPGNRQTCAQQNGQFTPNGVCGIVPGGFCSP